MNHHKPHKSMSKFDVNHNVSSEAPTSRKQKAQKPERHADAEDGSRDMKVPMRRTIPARRG